MAKKNLLITGINGFIGTNAAKYFSNDYEIFGIDMFGHLNKNFIQGEVDLVNLKKFDIKFDAILHFAGSSTVSDAQKSPEIEYAKSVLSVKHLLEFCKENNPNTKIIFSSSAAVYGNKYKELIKEDFELNPISVYGKHKVEAEKLLKQYNEQFGIKSNIIRFFSIYGEGLKKQFLWDFSNRLKTHKDNTINCFGTGDEERDFIHIEDALSFIKILLDLNIDFDIFNCGCGTKTKISEIQKLLCDNYGENPKLIYDNIIREGDPVYLCADISKAKSIGFNPKISIKTGLERYAEWFKNC